MPLSYRSLPGKTDAAECKSETDSYPAPPTGQSLHFNLNIPSEGDKAKDFRPPEGPHAIHMVCEPTPGFPPGEDCFART